MNAHASITCSYSHENCADKGLSFSWTNTMLWDKAIKHVNRIQLRIAKAAKQGKKNLVKRLQYMLNHSFYAKMLAVKKVVSNKGKHTHGVDGNVWKTSKEKVDAVLGLSDKNYKAKPLRRVFIEKYGKREKRPLGIPTMKDRAMQALYLLSLEPIAEITADKISFGFRRYRSTQDAMSYIFTVMSKQNSPQWVLEGDIKSCFDNIDHQWLLETIPMDKGILRKFLKAGYIFKGEVFPTDQGTPQGGICSATLANMTLDGMEKAIAERFWTNTKGVISKGAYNKKLVTLVRYADDFIVTARDEETAIEAQEVIREFLKTRGLGLSEEKTHITHINEGFDFLSWNFRKYDGKLLIKPSKKSIKKITEKIGNTIRQNKSASQETLIRTLNPIINGWANQHQPVCAKCIFSKLDHTVWHQLWQWAKRRHPQKNRKWIKDRYWPCAGTRKWVFTSESATLTLFADKPIVRNIPVKLESNAFSDKAYLINRRLRMRHKKAIAYLKSAAARQ